MKDCITLKTMKEIKIISNPVRMKVLRNYYAIGKPSTVKQMAVYMNEVPANIHYHVKKLVEIEVLELHHTESVNGIIAKFYLPTAKVIKIEDEDSGLADGFIDEKEIVVSNVFDETKQDFIKAMRRESEHDESTLISKKMKLTEEQYMEILEYISKVAKSEYDIEDENTSEYLFFSGIIEVN
jgi:DNA-binding transcriptional ArsR family regulator